MQMQWAGDVQGQNRSFDIFVLQQSPRLRFNRGALLNAGVLLLAGGQYDHFIFHDVVSTPGQSLKSAQSTRLGTQLPLGRHQSSSRKGSLWLSCLHAVRMLTATCHGQLQ